MSQNKPLIYTEDKNIKAIIVDDDSTKLENNILPVFKFNDTSLIADFIWRFFKNEWCKWKFNIIWNGKRTYA